MDRDEFRDAAKASIDHILNYYDNITDHSVVSQVEPGYLRTILPSSAPQDGEAWDDIRQDIDTKIVPGLTHWQSPNFMAFFPCAASYPSVLGELYSAAFSGACFNWICSPAVTELETIVLDWLAQIIGLPTTYLSHGPTRGGGVIQGSASESVLTAMVAARDKYLTQTLPDPSAVSEDDYDDARMRKHSRLVALGSAKCHSSTKKAAKILGLRYVAVPTSAEAGFAMKGPALRETLEMCRRKGWEPFFLTATLGTTDTCAVDDLGAIGDVLEDLNKDGEPVVAAVVNSNGHAAAQGSAETADKDDGEEPLPVRRKGEVWVHVDAAYAGSALVLAEVQKALGTRRYLRRFYSFNVNMHKWMLTHFDASCMFYADRRWLEDAMSADLHVYRNTFSDGGLVTDYRNWQIPLGRRFRALKVWFVLRNYGVRGLQEYVRRGIAMGEAFAGWVRERADLFEVVTGPSFALTVLRVAPAAVPDEERRNALTRRVCREINESGKVWVTGTVLDGTDAIRVMTANRTTGDEHVRAAWDVILSVTERVVAMQVETRD